MVFDHRARTVLIRQVTYDGRSYTCRRISYHFTERKGRTLMHVYCVEADGAFLKVVLDTDSLHWTLQEIRFHAVSTTPFQPQSFNGDAY